MKNLTAILRDEGLLPREKQALNKSDVERALQAFMGVKASKAALGRAAKSLKLDFWYKDAKKFRHNPMGAHTFVWDTGLGSDHLTVGLDEEGGKIVRVWVRYGTRAGVYDLIAGSEPDYSEFDY